MLVYMAIIGAYLVPHPPLIFPEIGKGEEKNIQATIDAYRRVGNEIAEAAPETIVLVTPHSVMYGDYFHISPGAGAAGTMAQFGASNVCVNVDYDEAFIASLGALADEAGFPAGIQGEKNAALDHASMIPLRFIIEARSPQFKVVRIGVSALSLKRHHALGAMIAEAGAARDKIIVIASGDLSHKLKADGPYGFAKEGPAFDQKITDIVKRGALREILALDDALCQSAGECGLRPLAVLAGALCGCDVRGELLSYEGPFGVGYAVGKFSLVPKSRPDSAAATEQNSTHSAYTRLAKSTVELFAREGRFYKPDFDLPSELTSRAAGVFVSIHKDGDLRGCIGTIAPTQKNIALEIMRNAICASTEDPRFTEISADELPHLTYSVDVLEDAEVVQDESALDAKKYGVIVSLGHQRGLLLPDLEGVDSVQQQIEIAMRKAGIPQSKRPLVTLQRFLVTRHH
jgi:AmmeMemoRadiSam system protein A